MAQILCRTLYSLQFMNQTITRRLKNSFEQIKPKHFLLSSTYPRKFREKMKFIQWKSFISSFRRRKSRHDNSLAFFDGFVWLF